MNLVARLTEGTLDVVDRWARESIRKLLLEQKHVPKRARAKALGELRRHALVNKLDAAAVGALAERLRHPWRVVKCELRRRAQDTGGVGHKEGVRREGHGALVGSCGGGGGLKRRNARLESLGRQRRTCGVDHEAVVCMDEVVGAKGVTHMESAQQRVKGLEVGRHTGEVRRCGSKRLLGVEGEMLGREEAVLAPHP